jgi:hypothetical protein
MTIATDIPIPSPAERPSKYPFAKLGVGHSVVWPVAQAQAARTAAGRYAREHPGWTYLSRTEGDSVRIWRTG